MKTSRMKILCIFLLITQTSHLFAANITPSSLATADQLRLDNLANKIYQENQFKLLRFNAESIYKLARLKISSEEADASLDSTIDELVFSSIQKAVNNDPYHPAVYWLDTGPHAWGDHIIPGGRYSYDNPDVVYRTVPISSQLHYVIHGRRLSAHLPDVTFSLITNPNSQGTAAILTNDDLVVNHDGTYDIMIDDQPANGRVNHLQATKDVKQLFIRNTLGNWATDLPDELSVKVLDDVSKNPPKSEDDIIDDAETNLRESIFYYGVGALGIKTMPHDTNSIPQPSQSSTLGTLVTQASSFGHFKLDDNKVLLVTVHLGGAKYMIVPATNPWMITVNQATYLCSMNTMQAKASSDGDYRFVISPKDPGVYNWVSTSGLHEGTFMLRWQGLPVNGSSADKPSVDAKVISLLDLPASLPSDTVWVNATERQQQLNDRAAGFLRRING